MVDGNLCIHCKLIAHVYQKLQYVAWLGDKNKLFSPLYVEHDSLNWLVNKELNTINLYIIYPYLATPSLATESVTLKLISVCIRVTV